MARLAVCLCRLDLPDPARHSSGGGPVDFRCARPDSQQGHRGDEHGSGLCRLLHPDHGRGVPVDSSVRDTVPGGRMGVGTAGHPVPVGLFLCRMAGLGFHLRLSASAHIQDESLAVPGPGHRLGPWVRGVSRDAKLDSPVPFPPSVRSGRQADVSDHLRGPCGCMARIAHDLPNPAFRDEARRASGFPSRSPDIGGLSGGWRAGRRDRRPWHRMCSYGPFPSPGRGCRRLVR